MSDAEKLIADVLVRHEPLNGGDSCDCGWWWDQTEGRNHPEHVAAEIVKAFGGLAREWRAQGFLPVGDERQARCAAADGRPLQARWRSEWREIQP